MIPWGLWDEAGASGHTVLGGGVIKRGHTCLLPCPSAHAATPLHGRHVCSPCSNLHDFLGHRLSPHASHHGRCTAPGPTAEPPPPDLHPCTLKKPWCCREVYDRLSPGFKGRCTAPLLVDARRGAPVCNESADILRMLNDMHLPGCSMVDLRPQLLAKAIDELNAIVRLTPRAGRTCGERGGTGEGLDVALRDWGVMRHDPANQAQAPTYPCCCCCWLHPMSPPSPTPPGRSTSSSTTACTAAALQQPRCARDSLAGLPIRDASLHLLTPAFVPPHPTPPRTRVLLSCLAGAADPAAGGCGPPRPCVRAVRILHPHYCPAHARAPRSAPPA